MSETVDDLVKECVSKGYVLFIAQQWDDGNGWCVNISKPGKDSNFYKSSMNAFIFTVGQKVQSTDLHLDVALRQAIDAMDKKNDR